MFFLVVNDRSHTRDCIVSTLMQFWCVYPKLQAVRVHPRSISVNPIPQVSNAFYFLETKSAICWLSMWFYSLQSFVSFQGRETDCRKTPILQVPSLVIILCIRCTKFTGPIQCIICIVQYNPCGLLSSDPLIRMFLYDVNKCSFRLTVLRTANWGDSKRSWTVFTDSGRVYWKRRLTVNQPI